MITATKIAVNIALLRLSNKIYNKIPKLIKTETSEAKFKNAMKTHLLVKTYYTPHEYLDCKNMFN